MTGDHQHEETTVETGAPVSSPEDAIRVAITQLRNFSDTPDEVAEAMSGAALAALDALAARNRDSESKSEYLLKEINHMRRAMQYAGTWDQFCTDYAAYDRYRKSVLGGGEEPPA